MHLVLYISDDRLSTSPDLARDQTAARSQTSSSGSASSSPSQQDGNFTGTTRY